MVEIMVMMPLRLQRATPVDLMHFAGMTLVMMMCHVGALAMQEMLLVHSGAGEGWGVGGVERRCISSAEPFQVGLAMLWQSDDAAGSEHLPLFEDAGALCGN